MWRDIHIGGKARSNGVCQVGAVRIVFAGQGRVRQLDILEIVAAVVFRLEGTRRDRHWHFLHGHPQARFHLILAAHKFIEIGICSPQLDSEQQRYAFSGRPVSIPLSRGRLHNAQCIAPKYTAIFTNSGCKAFKLYLDAERHGIRLRIMVDDGFAKPSRRVLIFNYLTYRCWRQLYRYVFRLTRKFCCSQHELVICPQRARCIYAFQIDHAFTTVDIDRAIHCAG